LPVQNKEADFTVERELKKRGVSLSIEKPYLCTPFSVPEN
jgi:hypothetical protein